jgi:hypothetical protein
VGETASKGSGFKVLPAERARQFVGGRDRERDWVHYIPLDRHLVWITFAGRWKCWIAGNSVRPTNKFLHDQFPCTHAQKSCSTDLQGLIGSVALPTVLHEGKNTNNNTTCEERS